MAKPSVKTEYRVASRDGRAIESSPKWSQDGPTLEQARDHCAKVNAKEQFYENRGGRKLYEFEVQSRTVIETGWISEDD